MKSSLISTRLIYSIISLTQRALPPGIKIMGAEKYYIYLDVSEIDNKLSIQLDDEILKVNIANYITLYMVQQIEIDDLNNEIFKEIVQRINGMLVIQKRGERNDNKINR